MKKAFYISVMSLFVLLSCEDGSPEICGTNLESEENSWLRTEIQNIENSGLKDAFYIIRATYQNQTVFVFDNCCHQCGTVIPVYKCDGTSLGHLGDEVDPDKLKNKEVFWKTENNQCTDLN